MTLAGVIGTLPRPPLAVMGLMIALYSVLGAVMDTLATDLPS